MRIFLSLCWCFYSILCFTQTLQKADSLFQVEAYEEANILYQTILDKPKNLTDSLLAITYHKLGVSQYYLLQDEIAINSWKKALHIRQSIFPANHIATIKNLRNIASAYLNLENYDKAKKYFDLTLTANLSRSKPDTGLLVDTYQELGYVLTRENDLTKAETYLELATNLSKLVFEDSPWEIADSYNLLVSLYSEYPKPQKMIDYGNLGLKIYEALEEKYEEDYISIADFYNNLAIAYELLGTFEKSIHYYEKSLFINQNYIEERFSFISGNHNNLAGLYLKIGQISKAIEHNKSAIKIDRKHNNVTGLSANYNTRGEIYLKQKKYFQALENYQKGITCLIADYTPKSIHELPPVRYSIIVNKPFLIQDLFDKAKAYQVMAKENQPIENLKYSLQTIDSISVLINLVRNSFESDASKQFLTTQAKAIFEKAITICYQLAQLTKDTNTYFAKALDYAERSKSIILLEAVKQSGAKTVAGIPANLLEREQNLKKKIADLEAEIFTREGGIRLTILRVNLSQQQQQLTALVDTFETAYPSYFQLKYAVETIDLKALQAQLNVEDAIVEYFIGKENTYWFYIDGQQIKMDTIEQSLSISHQIKAFRTSIFAPFTERGVSQDSSRVIYAQLGQELYQQLLAPALQEKSIKNLRIVPDGVLGYLPFDALLTDSLKTSLGNYRNYPFLQRTHRLCYSYSLALLAEKQQQQKQTAQKEILAIAPIFKANYPLMLGQTEIQLAPLLANVTTTEKLLAQYQGKALLKEAAQKVTFLQAAPNYAYLHLASHAQMNDKNGDYSFISFSQTTDSVQQANLLFVRELYNVPLKAEMVVLSACETALGELQEGEGIISLARAFSYAGANSIITTLWQVSDQRSAELVMPFYAFLAEGSTKDKALWQAKNTLIEQGFNAHPYNWAGFIPIGNMRAIELNKRVDWFYWGIGGVLILLAGLIGFRFLIPIIIGKERYLKL